MFQILGLPTALEVLRTWKRTRQHPEIKKKEKYSRKFNSEFPPEKWWLEDELVKKIGIQQLFRGKLTGKNFGRVSGTLCSPRVVLPIFPDNLYETSWKSSRLTMLMLARVNWQAIPPESHTQQKKTAWFVGFKSQWFLAGHISWLGILDSNEQCFKIKDPFNA